MTPFGLNHSVTFGIISAKGRRDLELATDDVNFQDFIQIDASINPGNSGGPVLDNDGRITGVAMQTRRRADNIGYMVPVPIIEHFLEYALGYSCAS